MEKHDTRQCKYLSFKIEKQKQHDNLTKTIECLNSKKAIKEYTVYYLNQFTFQFVVAFKTYTTIKFLKTLSSITDAKILNLKEYESLIARLQDLEYDVYLTYTNTNNNDVNTNDTDNNFKSQTTKEDQPQPSIEVLVKEDSEISTEEIEELEEIEEIQESYSSTTSNTNEDTVLSNVNDDTADNITSISSLKVNSLKQLFTPIQKYFIYGNDQQSIFKKITEIMTEQKFQDISKINYSMKNNYWEGINQNSYSLLFIVDFKFIPILDTLLFDLTNWCNSTIKTSNGYIEKRYKHIFIVYSQYLDLSNSIQDLKEYAV